MKVITDLQVGDSIHGTMLIGLALEVGRRPDGVAYRYVPSKVRRTSSSALVRFSGTVTANDPIGRILTVNTVAMDSRRVPLAHSPALMAEIAYSAFARVLFLSPMHYEPKVEIHRTGRGLRPTTNAIGTAFKAYRTIQRVHVPRA
jgi:hypothetical protein